MADKATKEALGTFQLPVRHLQPFQPHHCRLVLVGTAPAPPSCCLFLLITLVFHPRAVAGVLQAKGALCNGLIPVGNPNLASRGRCSKRLVSFLQGGNKAGVVLGFFPLSLVGKRGGKAMGIASGEVLSPSPSFLQGEGDARPGHTAERSLNRGCCALINAGRYPALERKAPS